jgi:hypothetical protein
MSGKSTRVVTGILANNLRALIEREEDIDNADRGNYGCKTTYAGGVRLAAREVANTLQDLNPSFDKKKFLSACGLEDIS